MRNPFDVVLRWVSLVRLSKIDDVIIESNEKMNISRLEKIIVTAKQRERERTERELKAIHQETIREMQREHTFEIKERDAEINMLNRQIADLTARVRKVDMLYLKTVTRSKINLRVVAEISVLTKRMRESIIESTSVLERIERQAATHAREISDNSQPERDLLGRVDPYVVPGVTDPEIRLLESEEDRELFDKAAPVEEANN